MDPQVGQLINNKYRLVRLIGDGGMGSVFEARHELLGTTVALKFLHNALARRKGLVERFLQEAQVSARIKSPHVVSVTDVDRTVEGLAYMVMEYVEGDTLQTLYEKLYQAGERLSYADAFHYMLQVLEGVEAAHKLAIVHRDLKPDNVMLSPDGRGGVLVKILDFGIAKLKASGEVDRGLTRPGVVMGTPEYMAPEQAFSADRVDARADVFSLGVMFFEMLAGRRPVGGDNAHAIAAQYLEGTIARLDDLAPSLEAELGAAVHKAMAAEPELRFDSVEAFRKAIEAYAPDAPAKPTQPSLADTLEPPNRAPVGVGAQLTPGLGGAGLGGAGLGAAAPRPAVSPPVTPVLPKTLPPELTFTPAGSAGATPPEPSGPVAAEPSDSQEPTTSDELETGVAPALTAGDFGTPAPTTDGGDEEDEEEDEYEREPTKAAREEANALRGGTEGAFHEGASELDAAVLPSPLRAGTEPMPPGALAAHGLGIGPDAYAQAQADAGAVVDPNAPAGSTVVGDSFGGAYPAAGTVDGAPAAEAVAPLGRYSPAPLYPSTTAEPGRRKSGASFLSLFLIAMLISGVVVGGVYVANRMGQQEDDLDDPTPIPTETAGPVDPPVDPPPADVPPPDLPPPLQPTETKPPPPRPTSKPTSQPTSQPTGQPSSPPPLIPTSLPTIPSVFPTLPPFQLPGLHPTAPPAKTGDRPELRIPPKKPPPATPPSGTSTSTRPKLRLPKSGMRTQRLPTRG